jgi:hypothetical protein
LDGDGLSGNATSNNNGFIIQNNENDGFIRIKGVFNSILYQHLIIGGNRFYFNAGSSLDDSAGRRRIRFGILDDERETSRYTLIQGYGSTPVIFFNQSGSVMAYFDNGGNLTSGQANSDIRIKKEILDISDDSALQMILAIEPKTYKYIDNERGTERVYGFIAQQIRSVIPEATYLKIDLLPNVMKTAICDKNKVYLDLTNYDDVPLNDEELKINIIFNNGRGDNYKIIEVTKDYFVVDRNIVYEICENGIPNNVPVTEVFVKGYQVNNFHKLKKDYIFTLNVCATQELHKLIEAQKNIIKSHEERIAELERKMDLLLNNSS